MTVFQQLNDLTQSGIAATVVGIVNLGAITTVYIQSWRHRDKSRDELSEAKEALSNQLTTSIREVRDDMQSLIGDMESDIREMDKRVRFTENWQSRHNGKEGAS